VIRDSKARRTPVRIVQRNTESVLVAAEGIAPGDTVVTEGVHTVRDGAEVLVAKSDPTPVSTDATPAVIGSGS
jgi:hypothetical protein